MKEYLFRGESIILTKNANFLLPLDENRFGLFGTDAEMAISGLPRGREAIGGKLYLTDYRLFFQSHRFNRSTGTLSIFLPAVAALRDVSPPLTLSRIMEVEASGTIYAFVIWGIPKLIAAVKAAQAALSPTQIDELRRYIREEPAKCGDGLNVFPAPIF